MSFKPDCGCWELDDEIDNYHATKIMAIISRDQPDHTERTFLYPMWLAKNTVCCFCGKPAKEVDGEES